jgi:hypothetical protein
LPTRWPRPSSRPSRGRGAPPGEDHGGEDQLSLAIGKRGQNARLTSKLTGWQIDIEPETVVTMGFEEKVAQAVQNLAAIPGLTAGAGEYFGSCRLLTLEDLCQVEVAIWSRSSSSRGLGQGDVKPRPRHPETARRKAGRRRRSEIA